MPNLDPNIGIEIGKRFKEELENKNLKAKTLSREIGASDNTLGVYVRGNVPDQWAYLHNLHHQGVDIRYVLLGIDPDYAGLTSEESLLLKAYRQLSPEAQSALLDLSTVYAKETEKD
ncbi:hypothetical protein B9T36_02120 [Acinetobacter sp. ANC 4204]|uniref:hypothetical protein n=1 Tax=Acinetobacter sp. ANC 4204 TaxID=1977884 RepID=UPI000A348298|nr:hypothetical protein [Acinetobacter sp. ANC 4204]OTG61559.1 hypothetical protein B9T36_02120 [Acinetobacter sp. ANC 4204]